MFALAARGRSRGRVVVFVPRWLPCTAVAGLPYRVIPIVSSLQRGGYAVDLCHELHENAEHDAVRRRLAGSTAAAVWCAEMNPAEQMPGLFAFLSMVRREAPSTPRLLGGGFVPLLPDHFDTEGLAELVRSEEVGALVSRVAALHGERIEARQPFTADALRDMDLGCFAQPAPLSFANHEPTLQLPTGLGCGKACPFCFYAPSHMRLLPAAAIAELMVHCHRRFGVRQFQLGELDFLAAPRRALELAGRLRALALPVRWFALASVPDLLAIGSDGLRTLVAGGLSSLEIGSEAGTDRALQRLGKRFTVGDVIEAQRRLVAAGVRPVHNILIGWPGESARDLRGTRALVAKLSAAAPHTIFHFRLYQAIPNTPMGDLALRGTGPLPASFGEILTWRRDQQRSMPWLSRKQERRARLWAERLLPHAYGEDTLQRRSRRARVLAALARWRCRSGCSAFPIELRLLGAAGVRTTWLA